MMSIDFRDWVNDKVMQYLPKDGIRRGNVYNCRCPICGDSKKNSMKKRGYYFFDKGYYFCHNQCGNISGMKLLELLSGSDYQDIKNEYVKMMFDGKHFNSLSSSSQCESHEDNLFNFKNVINPKWKRPLSDNAKRYLDKRRVLEAPYLKEELYSYYDKNNNEYILIPWKINDVECYYQINDFQKLNKTGMKYIFPRNMDKMIYGLDNIDFKYDFIILTEGVYDSLFLPNAVAIGGKYLTNLQYKIISKRFPKMKLVFSLDNDEPGLSAMAKILNNRHTSTAYSYFKWFDDDTKEKDVNDFIIAKNDVNIFTNDKIINSCMTDPVIMKMWMMKKGFLK